MISSQHEQLRFIQRVLESEATAYDREIAAEMVRKMRRASQPTADDQPTPSEKFCDGHCSWSDHHPDCTLLQEKADDQARRDAALAALVRKAIYYPNGELRESAEVLALDFLEAERTE